MLTKKPIPFSGKQVAAIRDALARRVSNIELIRTQIEHSEKTIVRLTAEQFERLDDITLNRASIVKGAAGTGKTMLASELYKRACEDAERTLFVCYNRLLGRRLKKDCMLPTAMTSGKSQVGSLHAIMLAWIEKTDYNKQLKALKAAGVDDSTLFGTHYPELAAKAAAQLGLQFDYLIVDEAQDIMKPSYIAMFDKVLKGGLRNGRWSFFGDFEKQAIYGACDLASVRFEIELITATQPPVLPLSVNCRNTDSIITETAKISGFSKIPSLPQNDSGPEVQYQKYSTDAEATDAVERAINLLINEVGIPAGKIVVISPKRFNKSAARNVGTNNGFTLMDCDSVSESNDVPLRDRTVMFSTIQSFKGMEAMAVILCDVEDVTSVESKSLMYVAMSRATSRLHVICARSVWNDVIECKNKKLL
jgi:superfamily I DNA and RNA helicase